MPVTKPTNLVRWADVSGTISEPASGKKDTGYIANDVPGSGEINWFFNLYYKWIAWLDAFLDQDHSWTGTQTYAGDVVYDIGGNVDFQGTTLFSENLAASAPVLNEMTGTNVPKAWGVIQTDGVGGITLLAGCNISGVSIVGSLARVTFAQAMSSASADYAVTATPCDTAGATANYVVQFNRVNSAATYVSFFMKLDVGAPAGGFQSLPSTFCFHLFAVQ